MKKIILNNAKNIHHLEFILPEKSGVYLLVGPNGVGKTTLLICLDKIGNPRAFRGFSTSRSFGAVDQYNNTTITYEIDSPNTSLSYRKKSKRWAVSPKRNAQLLSSFGFSTSIFIKADSNRINISEQEIRQGTFEPAATTLKKELNQLFETSKFNRLKRLRNTNGRGRPATFFYVIEENNGQYYSEKRFSTGELALLRLVEQLTSIQNNALVLLDEAELALHPRIQKKLLDYLNRIATEKSLTIFISTHSTTMIKATNKNKILLLEKDKSSNGNYLITQPCYPAKALGSVDFIDNMIYDAIFFVEDDMARLLLKKMLQIFCMNDQRFTTIINCIVPVGGYEQTARLAINTKNQLLNRSYVCAVWDEDVFREIIPTNDALKTFYEDNKSMIYSLGCTPEVWMIEKLEAKSVGIATALRDRFRIELDSILHSTEYTGCNSPKPRRCAKAKIDVVISMLSSASGDNPEIVLDELAQLIIDEEYDLSRITAIIAPMLSPTLRT